jgi:hypothetical protein
VAVCENHDVVKDDEEEENDTDALEAESVNHERRWSSSSENGVEEENERNGDVGPV